MTKGGERCGDGDVKQEKGAGCGLGGSGEFDLQKIPRKIKNLALIFSPLNDLVIVASQSHSKDPSCFHQGGHALVPETRGYTLRFDVRIKRQPEKIF